MAGRCADEGLCDATAGVVFCCEDGGDGCAASAGSIPFLALTLSLALALSVDWGAADALGSEEAGNDGEAGEGGRGKVINPDARIQHGFGECAAGGCVVEEVIDGGGVGLEERGEFGKVVGVVSEADGETFGEGDGGGDGIGAGVAEGFGCPFCASVDSACHRGVQKVVVVEEGVDEADGAHNEGEGLRDGGDGGVGEEDGEKTLQAVLEELGGEEGDGDWGGEDEGARGELHEAESSGW